MLIEKIARARLFDRRLLRRMAAYLRRYLVWMALACGLLLSMALLLNLLPVLLKVAVDGYLLPANTLPAADRMAGLTRVGLAYIGVSLAAFLLRYGQGYLMAWIGQRIVFDIRGDLYAKIMRLPLRVFDRNPVGAFMNRISHDVESMQKAMTDGAVSLVADAFALLAIGVFMLVLSPLLAATLFVLMPVVFLVLTVLNRHIRTAYRDVRGEQSRINGILQELLSGMLTIQLFGQERAACRRFEGRNRRYRDASIGAVRWYSLFFPSIEILNALSFAAVLAVGGYALLRGSGGMTIGIMVAFLAYVREIFRPLEDLSEKSNNVQNALAAAERVFGLLDTEEELYDPEEPVVPGPLRGEVAFEQVTFAYADEDWVLRDLSFRIRPGESVALVGATGSGKTSVISLIARFYDVQKGRVLLDGVDVRALTQNTLRRRVGIVLQDPFLFSGSVAFNIGLGDPAIDRDRMVEAARYVNAHAFIERLEHGYDTVLSERGEGLSTGQKQLLALARALAQNPDILLILDEATASVDTETERLIQEATERLMRNRTSIIIAHRLSTIRHVDRIFVMRRGQIVEEGTHAELMAAGGSYRTLYELLSHHVEPGSGP